MLLKALSARKGVALRSLQPRSDQAALTQFQHVSSQQSGFSAERARCMTAAAGDLQKLSPVYQVREEQKPHVTSAGPRLARWAGLAGVETSRWLCMQRRGP